MKRFFSSWQGFLAGIVAVLLFFGIGAAVRAIDPTAGVFDLGFLQWIGFGAVLFFGGIFVVWVGFQIAFPSTDKAADTHLAEWFEQMSPTAKWWAVQTLFVALLGFWILCLKIVPLQ